jgi:AcrR family transcriptional regulator
MPPTGKGGRYHHGDLRAALIETAIELIGEHGVRGFSLAEASRRLGVAVSAPYAHFADRSDVLAAIAVRGYQAFAAELAPYEDPALPPAGRLAAMASAYVRFAAAQRPLFEVLYDADVDKDRHPELAAAEKPVRDAFDCSVAALTGGDEVPTRDLATALEAAARGYALFYLDGQFGEGAAAVDEAAARAARATLALIASRGLLSGP